MRSYLQVVSEKLIRNSFNKKIFIVRVCLSNLNCTLRVVSLVKKVFVGGSGSIKNIFVGCITTPPPNMYLSSFYITKIE